MRIDRPDDYGVTKREIDELERDAQELKAQRAHITVSLQEALGRDALHFEEGEVLRLRRGLASLEAQGGLLADRVGALRAKLPSEEQRKAAGAEARGLAKDAAAASQRFGAAWAEFTEALAGAEEAAGRVSAARAEARGLLARLDDLSARHGLDVAVPRPPETPDAKVAYLTGLLLSQTALGEPDSVVVRDLAAARRRIAS